MTAYRKIVIPAGDRIRMADGRLEVPDRPIVGLIAGDGIGPDIAAASLHIWNTAMKKAYGGRKKIAWMELFAGERAAEVYGHYHTRDDKADILEPKTIEKCLEMAVNMVYLFDEQGLKAKYD